MPGKYEVYLLYVARDVSAEMSYKNNVKFN